MESLKRKDMPPSSVIDGSTEIKKHKSESSPDKYANDPLEETRKQVKILFTSGEDEFDAQAYISACQQVLENPELQAGCVDRGTAFSKGLPEETQARINAIFDEIRKKGPDAFKRAGPVPEYLMQKDKPNVDESMAPLKKTGVPEDDMAALEKHLAPTIENNTAPKDGARKVGFVSAGVESQTDGVLKVSANHEDMELPEDSDSEDEKVDVAQKEAPYAVFGGLVRKRDDGENNNEGDGDEHADGRDKDDNAPLGTLERIKRIGRGG